MAAHTEQLKTKMRTKTILAGAALLAAGALTSMAQSNVFSLNVVGYENTTLTAPGFTLIANQLDSGNNVFSNFFQSLPTGSQVIKWNPNTAAFQIAARVGILNGWNPTSAANTTLNPGEACFINLPGSTPRTNTFVGNVVGLVPTGGTNPTYTASYTNNLITGFTLLGSTFPASGPIAAAGTGLDITNIPTGSQVIKWNPVTQAYAISTKTAILTGWNPAATGGPTIGVGEGFFINASTAFTAVQNFTVN